MQSRRQVVAMLTAVVILFFVCLLPFRLVYLVSMFASEQMYVTLGPHGFYNLLFICRILVYINSSVNPIIYNLMSSKFREGFMKFIGIRSPITSVSRRSTFTTSTSLSNGRSRSSFDRGLLGLSYQSSNKSDAFSRQGSRISNISRQGSAQSIKSNGCNGSQNNGRIPKLLNRRESEEKTFLPCIMESESSHSFKEIQIKAIEGRPDHTEPAAKPDIINTAEQNGRNKN